MGRKSFARSRELAMSLWMEHLEARRLLTNHSLAPLDFSSGHQLNLQELLIRTEDATFPADLVIEATSGSAVGDGNSVLQLFPTLMAGALPDSPSARVDANSPAGGDFGGVVSVQTNHPLGTFICSGSVISPRHVLTAGHCFDINQPDDGTLDAGVTAVVNVNNGGNLTTTHDVETISIHSGYGGFQSNGPAHDIAVLTLSTPVPTGTPIYSIRETELADGIHGETASLVGYGWSGNGDTLVVPSVGDPNCEENPPGTCLPTPYSVPPSFTVKRAGQNALDLLVDFDSSADRSQGYFLDFDGPTGTGPIFGGATLGNDIETTSGPGDSGGPSFVEVGGELEIVAINTFVSTSGAAQPGAYDSTGGGIMTAQYLPWINQFIGVDLQVSTAEVSGVPAVAGTDHVYEVTVTNAGPNAATDVEITEALTLPAGVMVSSSATKGSFDGTTWDVGALPAGVSETLTLTLGLPPGLAPATDSLASVASVANVSEPDIDVSNDSSNVATSISRQVDVAVSQAQLADSIEVGGSETHVFTITATNDGPSDASGVRVNENLTLPADVVASFTPSAGSYASGVWTIGELLAGDSATLEVRLTALESASAGVDVISSSFTLDTVALNEPDSNPSNDSSGALQASITSQVDIALTQSTVTNPIIAGAGETAAYVVTTMNVGASNASGVQVDHTLSLPPNVSATVTPSVGSYSSGVWTIGDLAAGASATLEVNLDAAASAAAGTDVISSQATLDTASLNEPDGDDTNDATASLSTSIAREVDVVLTKAQLTDSIVAGGGETHVFTLTATNDGPSDASNVLVNETLDLPADVSATFVPSVGSFASGVWTIGDLAASDSATLEVRLTALESASAGSDTISSSSQLDTAALNEADTDASNDTSATLQASVARQVDIDVTQAALVASVIAGGGETAAYTITATNVGPAAASGVQIDHAMSFPPELSALFEPDVGTYAAGVWTIGDLSAGSSATLVVRLDAASAAETGVDVISSQASLNSASLNETDVDDTNDTSDSLSISVEREVDVAVTQAALVASLVPGGGEVHVYTVTATNAGPSDASNVQIGETLALPDEVTAAFTPSVGTYSSEIWDIGSLAQGASATLEIRLTASASAASGIDVISSSAALDLVALNETDSDNSNDASGPALISISAETGLSVVQAELVDSIVAGAGASNVYVVTATNSGPSNAADVQVNYALDLPAGVSAEFNPSVGSYADGVWALGSLLNGDSATLQVSLTAEASAAHGAVISSQAVLDGAESGGATADAVSSEPNVETTSVVREVDLVLVQTESSDPIAPGPVEGNLSYEITVSNSGPSEASGVSVDDILTLPAGVSVHQVTTSVGSYAEPTWTIGALAPGASETMTVELNVGVTTSPGSDVSSAATTSSTEMDLVPANNASTETTSVIGGPSVRVGGQSWAVDFYELLEGDNRTLPWYTLDQIQVVYPSAVSTAPTVVLLGPTDLDIVVVDSNSGDAVSGNEFIFDVPTLGDGYYRLVVESSVYDFGVLHSDGFVSDPSRVDIADVSFFIANYAPSTPIGPGPNFADFNGDGFVDIGDASNLISNYLHDLDDFVRPTAASIPIEDLDGGPADAFWAALIDEALGEDDDRDPRWEAWIVDLLTGGTNP